MDVWAMLPWLVLVTALTVASQVWDHRTWLSDLVYAIVTTGDAKTPAATPSMERGAELGRDRSGTDADSADVPGRTVTDIKPDKGRARRVRKTFEAVHEGDGGSAVDS